MKFFIESILYSYSQIFFSNRLWFGIAALGASFIVPEVGATGLGGVVISNVLAILLNLDEEKIHNGTYGFNGILFGTAAAYFYEITPFLVFVIFLFIIMTFFIAAVLENLFYQLFNLPGLSLPFIVSFYIFIIFLTNFENVGLRGINFAETELLVSLPSEVLTYLKSFALILFQSNVLSGVVILIIVLLFSRVMVINSIIAFTLNFLLLNMLFSDPSYTIVILSSLNAIITAFALGGSLIILSRKSIFLLLLSTSMIIIFTGFFSKFLDIYYLPVLVLPFNMVVLSTIYSLKFRQEHTDLVLLYFKPGSPEENYYYHRNRRSRFDKFKKVFPEMPFFGEWFITQGFEGKHTHKDAWKYAWDFEIKDENSKLYRDEGNLKPDYYCYNTPVAAPLDAEVVRVIDNIPDNKIGDVNLKSNWGNTIILKHDEGLYSSLSHLKMNSFRVKPGDFVKKGELLAHCGNSGRSPIPHLHFQFQLTDKLGDKTTKFPFAHFLEKQNGKFELKTFDYPEENSYVRNIEEHRTLKKAFNFKLGDELEFNCELNDTKFSEKWIVKVDMLNQTFIESNKGSKIFIYPSEKVFYITNFLGNKNSALYYFYLNNIKVPLGYMENLIWRDSFPVSNTIHPAVRFISEFFLLFYPPLKSEVTLTFGKRKQKDDNFVIKSEFENSGTGMFSFYKTCGTGVTNIDSTGFIDEFYYSSGNTDFSAKLNTKMGDDNESAY